MHLERYDPHSDPYSEYHRTRVVLDNMLEVRILRESLQPPMADVRSRFLRNWKDVMLLRKVNRYTEGNSTSDFVVGPMLYKRMARAILTQYRPIDTVPQAAHARAGMTAELARYDLGTTRAFLPKKPQSYFL